MREFFTRARVYVRGVELTAHFHNTRGQGLANALAALEAGVTSFESSFGELGGCPVPPGSTGNVASEDLVSMFHEMGVETGIDLEAADRRLAPGAGRSRTATNEPRPRGGTGEVEWRLTSTARSCTSRSATDSFASRSTGRRPMRSAPG